jgi:hypothetical protein
MTPSEIEPATFRIVTAVIGHIQVIQNKKILRGLIQFLSISNILHYDLRRPKRVANKFVCVCVRAHTHTHTHIYIYIYV